MAFCVPKGLEQYQGAGLFGSLLGQPPLGGGFFGFQSDRAAQFAIAAEQQMQMQQQSFPQQGCYEPPVKRKYVESKTVMDIGRKQIAGAVEAVKNA